MLILQTLFVAMIVLSCTGYAVWTLMPASAQRALASALLKLPLPGAMASPLKRAADKGASGCGSCGSCEPKAPVDGAKPITIHWRRPH